MPSLSMDVLALSTVEFLGYAAGVCVKIASSLAFHQPAKPTDPTGPASKPDQAAARAPATTSSPLSSGLPLTLCAAGLTGLAFHQPAKPTDPTGPASKPDQAAACAPATTSSPPSSGLPSTLCATPLNEFVTASSDALKPTDAPSPSGSSALTDLSPSSSARDSLALTIQIPSDDFRTEAKQDEKVQKEITKYNQKLVANATSVTTPVTAVRRARFPSFSSPDDIPEAAAEAARIVEAPTDPEAPTDSEAPTNYAAVAAFWQSRGSSKAPPLPAAPAKNKATAAGLISIGAPHAADIDTADHPAKNTSSLADEFAALRAAAPAKPFDFVALDADGGRFSFCSGTDSEAEDGAEEEEEEECYSEFKAEPKPTFSGLTDLVLGSIDVPQGFESIFASSARCQSAAGIEDYFARQTAACLAAEADKLAALLAAAPAKLFDFVAPNADGGRFSFGSGTDSEAEDGAEEECYSEFKAEPKPAPSGLTDLVLGSIDVPQGFESIFASSARQSAGCHGVEEYFARATATCLAAGVC